MKRFAIVVLMIFAVNAKSTENMSLSMPSASQNFQSDRVRADGFECQNAIGSGTNLEFGVVGILDRGEDPYNFYGDDINSQMASGNRIMDGKAKDVGVYARIIVPIGGPKERVNCNTLYQLELRKRRLQVQKLEQELNQLRNMEFEN